MKPKLFIGSSVEKLNIAYAMQESLEYDAQTTVWTQGIFQLSSNSLDDLLKSLKVFDFAIFVFHPDDLTKIRQQTFQTIRDNLIFELGLFIGKLGKEHVFFLIPNDVPELHLPTDLLGVTPGTFDSRRDDGNLMAALGPFCNQVRERMKNYSFENLVEIDNETKEVKRIAFEKPSGWEFSLVSEMLESKLISINKDYDELVRGLVVQRTKKMTGYEFFQWYRTTLNDYLSLVDTFKNGLEELTKSFGPPSVAGKVIEIKNATDRLIQICKELLCWEFELHKIIPPDDLMKAKELMKGWSKIIIDQVNQIPIETRKIVSRLNEPFNDGAMINIELTIDIPDNMEIVMNIFKSYDYSN